MAGYSFDLNWTIAGERQLARRFTRLAMTLSNYARPLARMARDVIYPEIRHQFQAEGDPGWDPLSAAYAAWKARKYPGKPKLQATGALLASLTNRRAKHAIYTLTKDELIIGTSLRTPDGEWNLGLLHQLGAPKAKLPARPMMRLRESAQTRAVEIFARWLWEEGQHAEVGV
jgi:phage gpG-like protein